MKYLMKFIKNECTMRSLEKSIPHISKIKRYIDTTWGDGASLMCMDYEVKKILPLESVEIKRRYNSIKKTHVSHSARELNSYFYNPLNDVLIEVFNKYC